MKQESDKFTPRLVSRAIEHGCSHAHESLRAYYVGAPEVAWQGVRIRKHKSLQSRPHLRRCRCCWGGGRNPVHTRQRRCCRAGGAPLPWPAAPPRGCPRRHCHCQDWTAPLQPPERPSSPAPRPMEHRRPSLTDLQGSVSACVMPAIAAAGAVHVR